jgi:hypothetical protein
MRWVILAVVAGLVSWSIACGSGGGDGEVLLHLRGVDITPENYRVWLRGETIADANGAAELCQSIADLSPSEIVDAVDTARGPGAVGTDMGGKGTAVPDQEGSQADKEVAATILQEECDRIGN